MEELLPANIVANLPKAACNPYLEFNDEVESVPVFNGVSGQLLFRNATTGARRVTRQRLRKVFAEGLDIKWGKALSQLSPTDGSVKLEFEDGEVFDADYVLGTDGTSSKVREFLVGAEAADAKLSGFMFATCTTQYRDVDKVDAVMKLHPVASIAMGASGVGAVGGVSSNPRRSTSAGLTSSFSYVRQ